MAKPWNEVTLLPQYQALSDEEKENARNEYFADVIAPNTPTEELESARARFDEETGPQEDTWGETASKAISHTGQRLKASAGGLMRSAGERDERLTEAGIKAIQDNGIGPGAAKTALDVVSGANSLLYNFFNKDEKKKLDDKLTEKGAGLASEAHQAIKDNPYKNEDGGLKYYVGHGTETLFGNVLPMLGVSIATKSPGAGLAMMGGQVYGGKYAQSREEGRSPDQASMDGAFYALSETVTEKIPLGLALKGGEPFLRRVLKTGGAEGISEVINQVMQRAYDTGVVDENTDLKTFLAEMTNDEALREYRDAAVLGTGIGATMGGVAHPFAKADEKKRSENIKSIAENAAFEQLTDEQLTKAIDDGEKLSAGGNDEELASVVQALKAESQIRQERGVDGFKPQAVPERGPLSRAANNAVKQGVNLGAAGETGLADQGPAVDLPAFSDLNDGQPDLQQLGQMKADLTARYDELTPEQKAQADQALQQIDELERQFASPEAQNQRVIDEQFAPDPQEETPVNITPQATIQNQMPEWKVGTPPDPNQPVVRSDGKPFKNQAVATRALNNQRKQKTHKVAPIDGGFALVPLDENDKLRMEEEAFLAEQKANDERRRAELKSKQAVIDRQRQIEAAMPGDTRYQDITPMPEAETVRRGLPSPKDMGHAPIPAGGPVQGRIGGAGLDQPAKTLMRSDGTPFTDEATAKRAAQARGLAKTHTPVPVDGGFGLADINEYFGPQSTIEVNDSAESDRLMRSKDAIEHMEIMANDLIDGGGISLVPRPGARPKNRGQLTGDPLYDYDASDLRRTPSLNPEWFQSLAAETGISVSDVGKAIQAHKAGRKLRSRQKKIIEVLSADYQERLDEADANEWYAKRLSEPDRFDPSEYNPDWDNEARTIHELIADASAIDETSTEAAIMRTQGEPDHVLARQLREIINDNNARTADGNAAPSQGAQEKRHDTQAKPEPARQETQDAVTDLLGDNTQTAQAIADKEREKDGKRNPDGEQPSLVQSGDELFANGGKLESDLFSGGSIDQKAHNAATSPTKDLPEPTQAQKEAGNYKVGKISLHGLDISIENPRGSKRTGVDPDGNKWSITMKSHYGYFKGTVGKDKDHVDTFIGPDAEKANPGIFVVDQIDPKTGELDEHKVMFGYTDEAAARTAYLENYDKGWKGLGAITQMPLEEFKAWVKDPAKTKRWAGVAPKVNPADRPGAETVTAPSDEARPAQDNETTPALTRPESKEKQTEDSRPKRSAGYGESNKVFTEDAAAKARERLRKKLGRLNANFDPEMAQDGIILAGYHIEAGARKFGAFAKAMIEDLGEGAREYLRSWYESARHWPGMEYVAAEMTPISEMDAAEEAQKAADIERAADAAQNKALDKHLSEIAGALGAMTQPGFDKAAFRPKATKELQAALDMDKDKTLAFLNKLDKALQEHGGIQKVVGVRSRFWKIYQEANSAERSAERSDIAVSEKELESVGLLRKRRDRWQYKFSLESGWMTANSKKSAVETATEAYHKTPVDKRLTREQRHAKADADEFERSDKQWGHLSIDQLKAMYEKLGGTIADLYKAGEREMGEGGGRRTAAAVSNQGARDAGEVRERLKRYIDARREQPTSETKPQETAEAQTVPPEKAPGIVNNPDPKAKNLDGGPYTIDYHNAIIRAANAGELSLGDFHTALDTFIANQDEIKERLNKHTKKELTSIARRYLRGDEKKAELVEYAIDRLRNFYTLDKETPVFSYTIGDDIKQVKADYNQKLLEIAKSVNEQDLKDWATDAAKQKEEAEAKKSELKKALSNPETLDDYWAYMRQKVRGDGMSFKEARMTLSPEQRAKFDDLAATATRAERVGRKNASKTAVDGNAAQTGAEIIATKHTRDGYDLWVVKPAARVDRDDYMKWLAAAKKMGGWYSKFARGGAIPGFQFKDKDSAEAFKAYITEGNTDAVQTKAQERRDSFADDRSQTAVERLREMSARLEERGTESLNQNRKVNTSRRASMAARAEEQANADIAMAKTMANIADAIESGDAKFLDQVRQKVQVELLDTFVRLANNQKIIADYPNYADQLKHKYDAPNNETADYAEFPTYTAFRSDLARLGRQLQEIDGLKKLGDRIMKVADDVTDAYLEFAKDNLNKVATFTNQDGGIASFSNRANAETAIRRSGYRGQAIVLPIKRGENMIILSPSEAQKRGIWEGDNDKRISLSAELVEQIIGKSRRRDVDVPWQFDSAYTKLKRLEAMGIETPAEFRAALREYIAIQERPEGPNKIKEMERAMVGRANDGLDFFPTPETVADEMVNAAGIEDGMSVLEPSAGMGHIAERIRETGVEPDVVEFSSGRRELLDAKGFNVVGNDFMEVTGEYDRIVMNPPFSNRRDADHVRHAYGLLKPGGRLVAIMGEGVFFGSDKKAQGFREWLDEVGGTEEKLAEGTFQDPSLPVNTGVNARMVVIDKPTGDSTKFSRNELSPQKEWRRKIDMMNRSDRSDFVASVQAPLVLRELGLLSDIRMSKARVHAILKKHREIPIKVLLDLPQLMADPKIIYTRKNNDTNAVIEVVTKSGEPILVGMRDGEIRTITPKNHGERDGSARLAEEIGRSQVIYARDKKALDESRALDRRSGQRLPHERNARGQGLSKKILFKADIVKKYGRVDDGSPLFSREKPAKPEYAIFGMPVEEIEATIEPITRAWANAPDVVVVENMDDPRIPDAVRADNRRQMSQGATGDVEGFIHNGTVYLVAENLNSPEAALRVLLHEAVVHAGLQVFGKRLNKILDQIADARPAEVAAKAEEYGLDMNSRQDRRIAAEEVLAEMGQNRPEIGFVRRVVAAIRDWLRRNVPAFRKLKLTDDEIIQQYLIPARKFIEKDGKPRTTKTGTKTEFSRSENTFESEEEEIILIGGIEEGDSSVQQQSEEERQRAEAVFLSHVPKGTRYHHNSSRTARAIKAASTAAQKRLGNAAVSDLASQENLGPFSGYLSQASVEKDLDGNPELHVHIYGKEQIDAGLDDYPAQTYVVTQDGKLTIYGPASSSNTYREFVKRGWAEPAWDADGNEVYGGIDNGIWTRLSGVTPSQLTRQFGEVHARLLNWHGTPTTGLHWRRATGGSGGAKGHSGAIYFSRSRSNRTETANPVLEEARRKAGLGERPTFQKRVRNHVAGLFDLIKNQRDQLIDAFRQGTLDQFHGIKLAEQRTMGNLPAEQSPYVTARLATGIASVMRGILLNGQPQWAENGQHLEKRPDTKGLLEILEPVADNLDDFIGWMVGNRAARLLREGRENNFTEEEVAALIGQGAGHEEVFGQVAREFAAFKRSILDVAEEAGLIDPQSRQVWDHADWIPFYRQREESGETLGPRGSRGLAGKSSGIRQLKGGESALNDPLENIIMNFHSLLDASLKNNAVNKAIAYAGDVVEPVGLKMTQELVPNSEVKRNLREQGVPDDIVNMFPASVFRGIAKMWSFQAPTDPDVIRVMRDGKPRYFRVRDPLLLKAVTSFQPFDFPGLGAARAFKRVLTSAVTATPEFMLRNFIRDTASTAIISRDMVAASGAFKGMIKAYRESGAAEHMLFAGASFASGYIDGSDTEATARAVRRSLRKKGMDAAAVDNFMGTVIDSTASMWEKYRHVSESIENANREAVFEATARDKKNVTAAAFEAKDLMDFSLRGSWAGYQLLADVIPFFNARVQGMYRLGRTSPAQLAIRGGILLTLPTLALALSNLDNDDYDELPDWDKDTYWHFWIDGQHYRIPKPFEVGVAFATIPERAVTWLFGEDDAKKFGQRLSWNLTEQMNLVEWPQIAKPVIEAAYNYDSFSGRDIESMSDQNKLPHLRYSAHTSDTMRELVGAMGPVADLIHLSPKKAQHLVEGYLGTFGAWGLAAIDYGTRMVVDAPPEPEWRADDIPMVKVLFRGDGLPAKTTQHIQDVYEGAREYAKISGSIRALMQDGRKGEAEQLLEKYRERLTVTAPMKGAAKALSAFNRKLDAIAADREMTPAEKRKEIDEVFKQRNQLARKAVARTRELKKAAGK